MLRFDAFRVLRRLTLAGGLFKELRLPAGLRQLTLGAGLMYNDISGARRRTGYGVSELHTRQHRSVLYSHPAHWTGADGEVPESREIC